MSSQSRRQSDGLGGTVVVVVVFVVVVVVVVVSVVVVISVVMVDGSIVVVSLSSKNSSELSNSAFDKFCWPQMKSSTRTQNLMLALSFNSPAESMLRKG